MASVDTGSNPDFKTKMPATTDTASIQDTIRHVLYGGANAAAATVNSNAVAGALTANDGTQGLVGQLNSMKTSLTNSSIQKSFLTGKGQLITATASNTPAILSPGTDPTTGNDFVLRSNSAASSGLDWFNISTNYLPKTAGASHPLTGNLNINGVGGANDTNLTLTSAASRLSSLVLQESSVTRWIVAKNDLKHFDVRRYNASGTYVDSPIWVSEADGQARISQNMQKYSVIGHIHIVDPFPLPSGLMMMMDQNIAGTQYVYISNNSLPVGTYYNFFFNSTGGTEVEFSPQANVTLQSAGGMKRLRTTYSVATLVKHVDGATDVWMLFGDLKS